ncbi:MAG: 3-deoxy-manno-octulosonate cytidylyltransferase [Bacteroidetes bacterium GWF2_40_14]|nr:MAG: 3-deoxy-manno-octulosonate cytidylyltransferase [Bacteroidetes bacterium GWF2_40_14]
MKILAIIPSRYGSTRFPGKPLIQIDGKTMIQRVYERSSLAFGHVCVATDDKRIFDEVVRFGGDVVMTSSSHKSGTDRCYEALKIVEERDSVRFDIIVNVQGDEPFILPEQLLELIGCFDDSGTKIATLVKKFSPEEDIFNTNSPKVVITNDNYALYFSRNAIPFQRGADQKEWSGNMTYYKHIGLYAFTRDALNTVSRMEQTSLEKAEQLEQLRWLENGIKIKVAVTQHPSYSIDTPEDIAYLTSNGIIRFSV